MSGDILETLDSLHHLAVAGAEAERQNYVRHVAEGVDDDRIAEALVAWTEARVRARAIGAATSPMRVEEDHPS